MRWRRRWSLSDLGPGDEVLIPAHTYMATATSVLTVGAIPVIVDIDESITIDPKAVERAIGPAHQGHRAGAYVGRRLQHGQDHGDRAAAQTHRDRRCLPGRRRGLSGAEVRLDRRHRRFQLQLLQEHDLGRRRRRCGQRRQARQARPLRHRPLSFLLERPRGGEALRRKRRRGLRNSWERCSTCSSTVSTASSTTMRAERRQVAAAARRR